MFCRADAQACNSYRLLFAKLATHHQYCKSNSNSAASYFTRTLGCSDPKLHLTCSMDTWRTENFRFVSVRLRLKTVRGTCSSTKHHWWHANSKFQTFSKWIVNDISEVTEHSTVTYLFRFVLLALHQGELMTHHTLSQILQRRVWYEFRVAADDYFFIHESLSCMKTPIFSCI